MSTQLASTLKSKGNTEFINLIASTVLILLFVYTGTSKLLDINSFKDTLSDSPILGHWARSISLVIPVLEILISITLCIPRINLIALYASLLLLTAFTLYIIYMILFIKNLPCSCGGVISRLTWSQHIVFNLGCILTCLIGIYFSRSKSLKRQISETTTLI